MSDHKEASPQPLNKQLDDLFYRYRVASNNGERRLIEQEFVSFVETECIKARTEGKISYLRALRAKNAEVKRLLGKDLNIEAEIWNQLELHGLSEENDNWRLTKSGYW